MPDRPKEDEYDGLFRISDTEDDSDEDYFTIQSSGRILRPTDSPYDISVRIMQANRELFSQPSNTRRKPTSRVKFDLIPRLVDFSESGEITAERAGEEPLAQPTRRRESYFRRMTPITIPPNMMPRTNTQQMVPRGNIHQNTYQQSSAQQQTSSRVSRVTKRDTPRKHNE